MSSSHLHLVVIFSTLFSFRALAEPVVLGTQTYSSPHIGAAINTMQTGANYFNTQALQSILAGMEDDDDEDDHKGKKGKKGKGKKGKKGCGDKAKKQAQQAAALQFMVESLQKADCVAKGGTILPNGGCATQPALPPGTIIAIPKAAFKAPPPGSIPLRPYPGMPGQPYPGAMPVQPYPGQPVSQPLPAGFPPGLSNQLVNLN